MKTTISPREQTIMTLVAAGMKNKEIASEIGTTEHVIKNYMRAIYNKRGFWHRTELALWWTKKEFDEHG